ncbi:glycoside hydrolase family 130 protein [Sphingomonas oryzagri]
MDLVRPLSPVLHADPTRVMIRPFTPAEDPTAIDPAHRSRVERVVERILALDEATLEATLATVLTSLRHRHRQVNMTIMRRYHEIAGPLLAGRTVSARQAMMIGAYFSEEYAFEAAALFNPSAVLHPDQTDMPAGSVRLVIALRAVGEGHVSSITFRTATLSADGTLALDRTQPTMATPIIERSGESRDDSTMSLIYRPGTDPASIALFPVTVHQKHGMEDLRLVRFAEEDGTVCYFGTYSAFSGTALRQEMLRTGDFARFELAPVRGKAGSAKGLALFPRRSGGLFAMLGRQDHDGIWLLQSSDLDRWDGGARIIEPRFPWELVQIGNCGSPIEIAEGWLVIVHGVGPVRNYSIGACLLDRNDPSRLLARTGSPLISTTPKDRDGYVPNVVYSCGGLAHGRTLFLPYGVADSWTAFATIDIDALLRTMA